MLVDFSAFLKCKVDWVCNDGVHDRSIEFLGVYRLKFLGNPGVGGVGVCTHISSVNRLFAFWLSGREKHGLLLVKLVACSMLLSGLNVL